jgi:hypothetical protein
MVRVFVLFEEPPEPERYQRHNELCRRVPGATVRHGKVLRTLFGEPKLEYYAEFEFPDMSSFQAVARSEEFAATGKDAGVMGCNTASTWPRSSDAHRGPRWLLLADSTANRRRSFATHKWFSGVASSSGRDGLSPMRDAETRSCP